MFVQGLAGVGRMWSVRLGMGSQSAKGKFRRFEKSVVGIDVIPKGSGYPG